MSTLNTTYRTKKVCKTNNYKRIDGKFRSKISVNENFLNLEVYQKQSDVENKMIRTNTFCKKNRQTHKMTVQDITMYLWSKC